MVRKAQVADIEQIRGLIGFYARKKEMLPRSAGDIAEGIRDFFVLESGGKVLGCAALHIYSDRLAEIRSLAVDAGSVNKGIGSKLVKACIGEAVDLGLKSVFALTRQEEFFGKLGFIPIEKKKLPQKIWNDCSICPRFADCDEVAYVKEL
ncbi:MAG: N-acetyltransferase [Candidatus Omnitrophica bacterium]|nr:N-acetyltransferase [Candidatus Omnitrophota bacterium]